MLLSHSSLSRPTSAEASTSLDQTRTRELNAATTSTQEQDSVEAQGREPVQFEEPEEEQIIKTEQKRIKATMMFNQNSDKTNWTREATKAAMKKAMWDSAVREDPDHLRGGDIVLDYAEAEWLLEALTKGHGGPNYGAFSRYDPLNPENLWTGLQNALFASVGATEVYTFLVLPLSKLIGILVWSCRILRGQPGRNLFDTSLYPPYTENDNMFWYLIKGTVCSIKNWWFDIFIYTDLLGERLDRNTFVTVNIVQVLRILTSGLILVGYRYKNAQTFLALWIYLTNTNLATTLDVIKKILGWMYWLNFAEHYGIFIVLLIVDCLCVLYIRILRTDHVLNGFAQEVRDPLEVRRRSSLRRSQRTIK